LLSNDLIQIEKLPLKV